MERCGFLTLRNSRLQVLGGTNAESERTGTIWQLFWLHWLLLPVASRCWLVPASALATAVVGYRHCSLP